eukprot:6492450-Amphidinium_carterae.6
MEQRCGGSMVISVAKLGVDGLAQFAAFLNSGILDRRAVERFVQDHMLCPEPIQEDAFDARAAQGLCSTEGGVEANDICRTLAKHRTNLQDCVLCTCRDGNDWSWWRFVTASLNPVRLVLQPLEEMDWVYPAITDATPARHAQTPAAEYLWHWTYVSEDYGGNCLDPDMTVAHFHVVPETKLTAPNLVSSNEDMLPLASFLAHFEPVKVKQHATAEKPRRKHKHASSSADASMQSLLSVGSTAHVSQVRHALLEKPSPADDSSSSKSHESSASETDAEEQWQQLEDARTSFESVRDLVDACFRIDLEGGSWSVARHGRLIAGVRCHVRPNATLHTFCKQHKLPVSSSFSNNLYGDEGCVAAATLWRLKLHSMYTAWEAAGSPDTLHGVDLTGFQIPSDLNPTLSVLRGTAEKRIQEILTLRPGALRGGRT